MPRIYDNNLHSIAFIYDSERGLKASEGGGSGFFYGVKSERHNVHFPYIVTNRHVIGDAKDGETFVQINRKDGKAEHFVIERAKWFISPTDDLAVVPIRGLPKEEYEYGFISDSMNISDEFVTKYDIGAGDDVMMTGRFTALDKLKRSERRSYPVVRFGNLALNETLQAYNDHIRSYQESYFVEMKSVPGFSGSPVIVYVDPFIMRPLGDTPRPEFESRLLGVCWGYIPITEEGWDLLDKRRRFKVRLSSSMAGVIPVRKLTELLNQPNLVQMRKVIEDNFKGKAQ